MAYLVELTKIGSNQTITGKGKSKPKAFEDAMAKFPHPDLLPIIHLGFETCSNRLRLNKDIIRTAFQDKDRTVDVTMIRTQGR